MAHNWWETANALDFYNGPYSPRAIQGGKPYPGYHNWLMAIGYYCEGRAAYARVASCCCSGLRHIVCAARRSACVPVLFLLLTPVFYVWSMHSSGGSPIYVPQLWRRSATTTRRYGIAVVPLCGICGGRGSSCDCRSDGSGLRLALPVLSIAPWLLHPTIENWICWKESQVNSDIAPGVDERCRASF